MIQYRKPRRVRFLVGFEERDLQRARRVASEEGRSFSALVRAAVEQFIVRGHRGEQMPGRGQRVSGAIVRYLEEEFVQDWIDHGRYHGSRHAGDSLGEEARCFIEWCKAGKPTVQKNEEEKQPRKENIE